MRTSSCEAYSMSALRRWAACPLTARLTFSNNAYLKLTTEWIMLHGELAIGSVAAPHTRKATITFTDNVRVPCRLQSVSKTPVDSRGLGKMPENEPVETRAWDSNA